VDIDSLELHDALIKSASIDYANRRVTLLLDAYVIEPDKNRTSFELIFMLLAPS
jgi:hypothetical protein